MALPNRPITRKEMYLSKMAGEEHDIPDRPLTREEEYLDYIAKHGGGGGGGTSNYNELENQPQVNGTTLIGNKTTSDLIPLGNGLTVNSDGELEATADSAELTSSMTAAVTVGGLTAGTQYAQGTSLETIIRDMVEPTLYPALTAPSVSVSVSTTLFETGTNTYIVPTISMNRGSINPAYGTNGYRAGAATDNSGTWYYYDPDLGEWGEWFGSHSSGFRAWDGHCTKWYVIGFFADGEQPKDSKGNNYSTPYHNSNGEQSNTITFKFVDAIWANTSSISTVSKLSLVDKTTVKQRDLVFPSQTVANPEVFDIPASWTVTAVQVKNDLSGAWEDASSQFTITNTTHTNAASTSVNYKRYTFNMGIDTGSRTIRVKWS